MDTASKDVIQSIINLDLQINAIGQDIRNTPEHDEYASDLNMEAQAYVRQIKDFLLDLRRLAKEADTLVEREILNAEMEKHQRQLERSQAFLLEAVLLSSKRFQLAKSSKLLSNNGSGSELRHRPSTHQQVASAATDVTDSLRSLQNMMTSNVDQSQATLDALVSSSRSIHDTRDEFHSMSGHIHSSKVLLSKYKRRQMTDKVLIFLAVAFFFACVLYVLRKRYLYRWF